MSKKADRARALSKCYAKAAGGLAAELPDAEHVGPEGGLSGSRRKAESLSDILKRVVTEHVRGELPDNPTVSARGLRLVGRYGAPTHDVEGRERLDPYTRKVLGGDE